MLCMFGCQSEPVKNAGLFRCYEQDGTSGVQSDSEKQLQVEPLICCVSAGKYGKRTGDGLFYPLWDQIQKQPKGCSNTGFMFTEGGRPIPCWAYASPNRGLRPR